MISIRLRRTGKRKQPLYRLIVCDKHKDPWGDYLENLGIYNPRTNPSQIDFKADRIKDWIGKGAQCTDTVWNILVDQKIVEGEKRKTMEISTKRKVKIEKETGDKKIADEAKRVAAAAKKEAEAAAKIAAEEAAKEAEKAEAEAAKAATEAPVVAEAPAEAPADTATEAPAA